MAIGVNFFGVFVTATDHNRLQLDTVLELNLVLGNPITHLIQIHNGDLRSSELIQQ